MEFNIIVGCNRNSIIKIFNVSEVLKIIFENTKINITEFKFFFLFNLIFEFNNTFNIIKNTFGNANNFIRGISKGRNSVIILMGGLGPTFNRYFI